MIPHRLFAGRAAASALVLASASLVAAVATAPAGAATPRGLSPHTDKVSRITKKAGSPGPIVTDSKGNGYVAWESSASENPVEFCVIPKGGTCTHIQTLPLPEGADWDNYRVTQPFPVVGGKEGVLSVVAPSYDYSDVVVWTSKNMGKHFGEPQVISSSDYNGTGTDDVLRSPDADTPYYPDYFSIASSNVGLFYTFTGIGAIGALDPPSGFSQKTGTVPGAVDNATLGYGKAIDPGPSQQTQTIEAFSTNATKPRVAYFWSPLPGVSGEPGSLEHGPTVVSIGMNPRLAGGPNGLYLLSEDYVANPSKTTTALHLDVRKWDASKETFGSPTLVTKIPNDIEAGNQGGFGEDSATGALTVAWPVETKSGSYDMDVWTSSNGKSFSSPVDLGAVGYAYNGPARVATVHGRGFLTWQSSDGLELADLG